MISVSKCCTWSFDTYNTQQNYFTHLYRILTLGFTWFSYSITGWYWGVWNISYNYALHRNRCGNRIPMNHSIEYHLSCHLVKGRYHLPCDKWTYWGARKWLDIEHWALNSGKCRLSTPSTKGCLKSKELTFLLGPTGLSRQHHPPGSWSSLFPLLPLCHNTIPNV